MRLTRKLIKIHCPNYSFKWSRSTRNFGYCDWGRMEISLSKILTRMNTVEEVTDTILHEIAHATTHQGHNKIFYKKCEELGARPKRCYSSKDVKIPKKNYYVYTCKSCKQEVLKRGAMKKRRAHGDCCRKFNNNKYALEFELEFTGRRLQ